MIPLLLRRGGADYVVIRDGISGLTLTWEMRVWSLLCITLVLEMCLLEQIIALDTVANQDKCWQTGLKSSEWLMEMNRNCHRRGRTAMRLTWW